MKFLLAAIEQQVNAMPAFMRRVIGFTIAGGVAFIIDAGILMIGIEVFGLNPTIARLFSAPPALIANWLINRTYAFLPDNRMSFIEFGKFAGAKFFGLVANVVVFAILVNFSPIEIHPLVALVIVTAAAAIVNFLVLHFFVYPAAQSQEAGQAQ